MRAIFQELENGPFTMSRIWFWFSKVCKSFFKLPVYDLRPFITGT